MHAQYGFAVIFWYIGNTRFSSFLRKFWIISNQLLTSNAAPNANAYQVEIRFALEPPAEVQHMLQKA